MYRNGDTVEDRFAYQNAGSFTHGRGRRGQWSRGYRRPKYNVPLNIAETETAFKVAVYAICFDKENIKIKVTDGVLYITGTRSIDETDLPNFIRQEYPIRSFERQLALTDEIDSEGISARQQDGVLIITLPKTDKAQQAAPEIKVD